MKPQMIEIGSDGQYLSLTRGFLSVKAADGDIGKVPVDDIAALIITGRGVSYSNDLMVKLAESNVPVVLCARNYSPVAWLWPLTGNYQQAARMDAQVALSASKKKRLWKDIVTTKINFQADHLEALGKPAMRLRRLAGGVKSGDSDNREAQAARVYWRFLFGSDFTRSDDNDVRNAMLNYAYAVIRSALARAVSGAGLHPTLALAHSNQYNPMRLVDDLMEPYRPLADALCHGLYDERVTALTSEEKQLLSGVLSTRVSDGEKEIRFLNAAQKTAQSLVAVCMGTEKGVWYPASLDVGSPAMDDAQPQS